MPANAPRIVQFPAAKPGQNQGQIRRPQVERRRPWLRAAILLCTALYLIWAGSQLIRQEVRMRELRQSYERLQAAQESLQQTNESLQSQIEGLANDPEFLEQLARQMGMVKPRDTIYLPIDSSR